MAVFSIVKLSELEGAKRIDAEYYQPEYLEATEKLKNAPRVAELTSDIRYGLYVEPEYLEQGVDFIRAMNLLNFWIDGEILKINEQKVPQGYRLKLSDSLIVRSGANTGSVGLVYPRFRDATFGSYTIRLRFNRVNPYFAGIFLNTKYGILQTRRLQTGMAQPNLNIPNIKEIKIPVVSKEKQKEIEKLCLDIDKEREKSENLYSQAENLLLEELGLKDFKPEYKLTYTTKLSDAFSSRRIDAEYFQPAYEEVMRKIREYKNGYAMLLKYAENVKPDFNPANNPDKIFNYIELVNIDSSIGVINSASEVKGEEAPSRARRILKQNDVVVSSVEGSLEKVALVSKEFENALASTGFFQFRVTKILPEVLLVFSKSIVLQAQLKKECSGTILTAVSNEAIKRIIIPNILPESQQKIASLVQQSHEARRKAKELLETAKRAVEIAIEKDEKEALNYISESETK